MLKKIITLVTMLLTLNSFAGYTIGTPFGGGVSGKLTIKELTERFKSETPMCFKQGRSIKKAVPNKAYLKKYGNDKTPCQRKWVSVINIGDLDAQAQQIVLGYKK